MYDAVFDNLAKDAVPNKLPVILPFTRSEPVNECTSSSVSPNLVDPLSYIMEAETYSV